MTSPGSEVVIVSITLAPNRPANISMRDLRAPLERYTRICVNFFRDFFVDAVFASLIRERLHDRPGWKTVLGGDEKQ